MLKGFGVVCSLHRRNDHLARELFSKSVFWLLSWLRAVRCQASMEIEQEVACDFYEDFHAREYLEPLRA